VSEEREYYAPDGPPDLTDVPTGGALATVTVDPLTGTATLSLTTHDETEVQQIWSVWTASELRRLAHKLIVAAEALEQAPPPVTS
jgi:hypothetical protein